jgi:hypothetical protein
MIKVVVCDGDGTLQLPYPSEGIRNLIGTLPSLDIKLAVVSNNRKSAIERSFHTAGLQLPELIVTSAEIGVKKPSPEFVYRIRDLASVDLHEIIYLGDDDRTDMFCAINARILPVAAKYSNAQMQYGLPIASPEEFQVYLEIFGRQAPPYFGWSCSTNCMDTRADIDVRALLGNHGGLTSTLEMVLKHQRNITIGSKNTPVRAILFHYFLSQCYLSGLIAQMDWITVYPGHRVGSLNQVLQVFSAYTTKMFRDRFIPDLIIRHQDAPKSQYQGSNRNIFDQFRTIHVNPKYRDRIQDKSILVLDDFTTYGYSVETARRMLSEAGSEKVVCLAMAKFRSHYTRARITKPWDPFAPCTLTMSDISLIPYRGEFNDTTDEYFKNNIWQHYRTI